MNLSLWQSAEDCLLAARLERLLSNFPAANKYLEKCYALQGGFTDEIRLEGMLLASETGSMNEQTENQLWQRVKEKNPDAPQILRSLAKVYITQWRFLSALDALSQWLTLTPQSAEAREIRAQVWGWLGKSDKAEKDLRDALAIAPHRDTARVALVELLLSGKGDPREIMDNVQYLLKRSPDQPSYLVLLARCKLEQGDLAAARQLLEKALQSQPANLRAQMAMAKLELQSEHFADAEKWARKIVDEDSTALEAYHLLAESMKLQGDPKKEAKAEAWEKKFLAGKDDHKRLGELLLESYEKDRSNPDLLAEMGTILLRLNQAQAARICLEQALAKEPGHPVANSELARYYEKQGDYEKAAQYAKKSK
jgi:tetratricopeptide (TPR) repeat protein